MVLALKNIPRGWWYALAIGTFFHPVANLASRVGVANFGAHPIAYTCVIILGTALGLFLVAKPGPLGWDTLRRSETWIYGLLNTAVFAFGVAVMLYLTATETSAVLRISAVMAFVLSVLFLGHRTTLAEVLSLLFMAAGVVIVLTLSGVRGVAMLELCALVILSGIAQGAQMLVVERHKTNRVATSTAQNLRVTAVVMGVTATLMTGLFLGLGWVKDLVQVQVWPMLPTVHDFFNWQAFVVGLFIGVIIRAPSKYCEFYAAKTISAKYLLAVIALQPIFTGFFEICLDAIGYMPMRSFSVSDWVGLLMVSGGSALLAVAGVRRHRKGQLRTNDNPDVVFDQATLHRLQDMLQATLVFSQGNRTRAAKLLGVTRPVFDALLEDDKQQGARVTQKLAQQIQDRFDKSVAMADPLTGLSNRLEFNTLLHQAMRQGYVSLLLLDLDKFKPINDTYGHGVGDEVLKLVARRLTRYLPKAAFAGRQGGDEFVVCVPGGISTAVLHKLEVALAKAYRTSQGLLTVGVSCGLAHSEGTTNTVMGLMDLADKAMYRRKAQNK